MTLRKFKDAYQDAVQELPQCHMDVERVLDEQRHAEFVAVSAQSNRYKAWMRTVAVAAGVFILCGVGTVTAMNYQKGIIMVKETGYSIASQKVAVIGEKSHSEAVEEELVMTMDAGDDVTGMGINAEADLADYYEETTIEDVTEDMNVGEAEVLDADIMEPVQYASLQEFRANENIVVAIPEQELLGEFEEQNIMVMDEGTYVSMMFCNEEKRFSLTQQDTRGYEQYASSTTYMGESVNERSLVNDQGLNYVVFDTMEEGVIVATHAVISVNGRDLCFDFYGYSDRVIENILKQIDFSIYFQEERIGN